MKKKIVALLAGAMLMMATSAMAVSIGPNGSYLEANNGIKYYDTGAQSVYLTDTDGYNDDATAFLLLELAGYAGSNTFGIYSYTQTNSTVTLGNTLQVFAGADSAVTDVTLAFNLAAGTVTNSATNISANIGQKFGFYITTPEHNTFYTHTSLNAGGLDYFKVYNTSDNKGTGLFGSDVVLGIEDLFLNKGDRDFNDMVVGVTDVAPVPEPGTMMLLGIGMLGLAIYGKRRMNKEA